MGQYSAERVKVARLQHLLLSKTDFDNANWHNVIDQNAEKNCENYYREFFQRAAEAQTNGDAVNEEVFTVLGAVCSMWLRPDTSEVFHPLFVFYDPPSRGFVLDDLSDEHLSVLAEVAPTTSDHEMRARLADIGWVKGRSKYYRLVEIAVRAYLESAKWMLSSPEEISSLADVRLKRALSLAASIRNQPLVDFALDEVENIIVSHDQNDQEFPFAILLRLLLAYPSRHPATFSESSEKLARASEAQSNWMYAQVYWEIKADWDIRAGNLDNQRNSLAQAAESYVRMGEIYAQAAPPNYGAACFQLERAIEILRNIGGMRVRCEEIHKSILKYQKLSLDDFQNASTSLNIAEYVEQAQRSIKGKPLVEAILGLVFAQNPTDKGGIRSRVEEYLQTTSFHTIFPLAMVDSEGRRTAISPSLLNADEAEREQVIKARMFMEATRHQQLIAAAIIEPMVYQISLDHYLTMNELAFLVRHNAFIPPDRAYIYLKGLHAGFQGDLLVATHILIPQLENSLRHILNQRGVVTSSLNTQTGIQENFTLDTLLEMPALEEVLGADIVFDLQCLLIRRFGSNLRNRLSHGLMHSAEFSSQLMTYLWWLILHLCCRGLPQVPNDEQDQENTE